MKTEELRKVLADHAEWVADNSKGKRADLRGADLDGADLRGVSMRWADLSMVDLRGADLRGADLRGVSMRWADLADMKITIDQKDLLLTALGIEVVT